MAQIIFDFSKLVTSCLHDKKNKFTNAIKPETINKNTLAEIFKYLQTISDKALEEVLKSPHFHLIGNTYIREKISKLIGNAYMYDKRILQIPLNKEIRLYGIIQKIGYTNYMLFQALLLDPNHLIYEEHRFTKLKNLTCLFSKIDCANLYK